MQVKVCYVDREVEDVISEGQFLYFFRGWVSTIMVNDVARKILIVLNMKFFRLSVSSYSLFYNYADGDT